MANTDSIAARLRRERKPKHEANGRASKGGERGSSEAILLTASEIAEQNIEWLWQDRIPYGMLSILDGDPDLGKSTMMMDLAARVSRGWPMPPENTTKRIRAPADVLILNAEDPVASVIRPRLRLAGADLQRVRILTGIRRGEAEDDLILPFDIDHLRNIITAYGIKMVNVDPLMAYLDSSLDVRSDADMRRCLRRLGKVAEDSGAALVVNRHLNKFVGGPALYRGGGSIGIIGACRSGLIVGKHPQQAGTMVLARNKGNLAPAWRSLTYSLERVEGEQLARIGWGEETDLTKEDILGHTRVEKTTKAERVADAIRRALANGPMPSKELEKRMEAQGYSRNAIEDGRRKAGVKAYPDGFGKDCVWMVHIPESADEDAANDNPWA